MDLVGSGAGVGSGTAGAARTAAPVRQGGANKQLFSGGGGRAEERPHTRRIDFQLSRQELVDLLPPARGHAMDLTHGWSDQRRTAHRKAVKEGAAEEVTS